MTKEDYEEQCCCGNNGGTIPSGRVLEKLDEYFASNDYAGAERHLSYWMNEARQLNDRHGLLLLSNECIGYYRKCENRDKALAFAESAISIAKEMGLDDSVTMGTTYINAATAYSAFGEYDKAIALYGHAKTIYEKTLPATDRRLGGLYNNMALAVMASGDLKQAEELFGKALSVMESIDGGETGAAITYCNLADLVAKDRGETDGEELIGEYLEKAMKILDGISDRKDGEYAYACEKCAPTFGHYGYFVYEKILGERARSIYEGH